MVGVSKGWDNPALTAEELQVIRYAQARLQKVQQRLRSAKSVATSTCAAAKAQKSFNSALSEKQQRAAILSERLVVDRLKCQQRCEDLTHQIREAEQELANAQLDIERAAVYEELQAEVQQAACRLAEQLACNEDVRQHLEWFVRQTTLPSGVPAPRPAPPLGVPEFAVSSGACSSSSVRRSGSANAGTRRPSVPVSARPSTISLSLVPSTPRSAITALTSATGPGGVAGIHSLDLWSSRGCELRAPEDLDGGAMLSEPESPESGASRLGATSGHIASTGVLSAATTSASRAGSVGTCNTSNRLATHRSTSVQRDAASAGCASPSPHSWNSTELTQLLEETERLEASLRKEQDRTANLNHRLETLRVRGRQLETNLRKARGASAAKLRELQEEVARSAEKAHSLMSLAGPPIGEEPSPRMMSGPSSTSCSAVPAVAHTRFPVPAVSTVAKAQATSALQSSRCGAQIR